MLQDCLSVEGLFSSERRTGQCCKVTIYRSLELVRFSDYDDDELMLNVLRCHLTY